LSKRLAEKQISPDNSHFISPSKQVAQLSRLPVSAVEGQQYVAMAAGSDIFTFALL